MVWDGTLAGDSAIGLVIGSKGTIMEDSAVGFMPKV
jgi:hypothetical protein